MKHVNLEAQGAIGWLRFNRPPVNAIDRTMLLEIEEGFDRLNGQSDVRVVVFSSALEKYFSAGADLAVFHDADAADMDDWIGICHRLANKLRQSGKPFLAAIHGTAVGGGLEMCLHADLRFAATNARFGQPEINIAFVPPVAGTQALVRLVGRSEAFKMLYSGELIDASRAYAIGLVDFLATPGALDAEVQAFAEKLATRPANALSAIRRCLIDGGGASFADGLAVEAREAAALSQHANFKEGLAAFIDRRKPVWE